MFDRDVEDTRQPKESPTHSMCDTCGEMFDNDDLNYTTYDEWVCDDCLKDHQRKQADD